LPAVPKPSKLIPLALILLALLAAGCGGSGQSASSGAPTSADAGQNPDPHHRSGGLGRFGIDPHNVYAYDCAACLSPAVKGDFAYVYVPNSMSNTVTIIDQRTLRILRTFPVGELPQHITPAWDLSRLYVDNDVGNSLTPLDPRTGRPGTPIPVEDPYNLYFTPDGRYAIVVAERLQKLDFRDPQTMRLEHSVYFPACAGLDHADFSVNGRYMYASCEFAGRLIKVDLRTLSLVGTVVLGNGYTSPQDVKLAPDGKVLYAADQASAGLWEIDPQSFKVIGFLHTGAGAHGLYPSRDARLMYVSNRRAGTISVVSFATRRVVATWYLPQPSSPDMGGVSADGSTLWLSGRYNAVVYAIDTRTGHLRAEIPVGLGPHGLCVWPQPGRYSLGHTGIMR
jgi:YVTN family beta-propeller protein